MLLTPILFIHYSKQHRTFFLWRTYGGCLGDAGYLVVVSGVELCTDAWELSGVNLSVFLYTTSGSAQVVRGVLNFFILKFSILYIWSVLTNHYDMIMWTMCS